jgi:uncharacterized membrane protein YbhN (UPF0104 family)
MRDFLRRCWPVLKALFALAILAGVGLLFVRILRSDELQAADRSRSPARILWDQMRDANPAALLAGGGLYLTGLLFSAVFWLGLLRRAGQPLPAPVGLRAYYISHLGKYAPVGKGWALLLRTTLASTAGVRPEVAVVTATYETLTTMASGALLTALLGFWYFGHDDTLLYKALGLLALAGIPILPGVFDRVVNRAAARFRPKEALPKFHLGAGTLLTGLTLSACGWGLLGASLVAVVRAIGAERDTATAALWGQYTAFVAVSWVAGFVASTPGGLGVRELLLQQALAPKLGAQAVVAVVLLRLLWTAAELAIATAVYWLPNKPLQIAKQHQESGP